MNSVFKSFLILGVIALVEYMIYIEAGVFTALSILILLAGFGALNKNITKETAIREVQNGLIAARLKLNEVKSERAKVSRHEKVH